MTSKQHWNNMQTKAITLNKDIEKTKRDQEISQRETSDRLKHKDTSTI